MASFGSQFRGIQFTMAFVVSQLGVRLATLHLQPESRGREREVGGGDWWAFCYLSFMQPGASAHGMGLFSPW